MITIPFLVAVCLLGNDTYMGMGDPWYQRACLASYYLRHWFQITDVYKWMESKAIDRSYQRRACLFYWMLARKHFKHGWQLKQYKSLRHNKIVTPPRIVGSCQYQLHQAAGIYHQRWQTVGTK